MRTPDNSRISHMEARNAGTAAPATTIILSVINWRSGAVVWTGPSDGGYVDAIPEPGGQGIAVSVRNQHPQTGGFPPRDIYVVTPDDQAVKLLTDVM